MTLLLALSSLLSRLLGVYRNHALANLFGASEISDAYFAAFQVPDTLYRLLVFGAISASFVPLYLMLHKRDDKQAQQFVASVMNGFLIFVALLALVFFTWADFFIGLLYPTFSADLQAQTAVLMRIMLLSPLFFTCSSIFAGIQNAFRIFWGFALAPIVYNGGIIFGILVLAPQMGIEGVAWGVVLGAFLHAFVQLIPAIRLGFIWKPVLVWSAAFKKLLVTAIPRILSMASFQLNFFIEGLIATTLLAGNLTVLRYAQDLQSFSIGIVGVSIAITSFSVLSHLVIDGKFSELASYIRDKLDHLFLLMIPAAFGLYVLRLPLTKLVLEGGTFDEAAVLLTANTLAYLCIGLVAAAISPLVNRVFFAFHDTFWPFIVMVVTVVGNTALAIWLAQSMGVEGIGLSSSISTTLSLVLLLIILRWKYIRSHQFFSFRVLAGALFSSAVMAGLLQRLLEDFEFSSSWLGMLAQTTAFTGLGVVIYAAMCFLLFRRQFVQLLGSLGK